MQKLQTQNLLKAAAAGLVASLAMFVIMMVGIHVTGIAPFNTPPSAAFLEVIGMNVGPMPLLAHFGYGAFWAVVLVALVGERINLQKALGLAGGLWLFMMVVYSPAIGWGFFGFGEAGELAQDAALYLEPGPKYAVITLVLHGLYGVIVGKLGGALIGEESRGADDAASSTGRESIGTA